ncbi:MAG: glycosyl hydrolase [Asticcacaulis sp.]
MAGAGTRAFGETLAPASPLYRDFILPPPEARPMVRWWWFGGAVEAGEIEREIAAMQAGGFGGFEIQPVYPLSLDDPSRGIRNKPYLSQDFLAMVSVAARAGRAAGLRADITMGSGWPFGGPHIDAAHAASRVLRQELPVPAGATEVELPTLPEASHYLAAFIGDTPATLTDNRAIFSGSATARTLSLIVQGRTGQQVKRPTIGAEGYVLDHLNSEAVRRHIDAVGEPLLAAFGPDRPYSIFSDSLEVYGANWTDDLLSEFMTRRGYDLTPHLLKLFVDTPASPGLRYDWGLTLSELVNERYLTQVTAWAKTRQTLFRSQTYGIPAVTLSSNRLVDLAEGEGADWRSASSTRWASSANHVYGQTVTSAESWTWLHKGAFRATPLDIKAEADRLLLSGVNQFIAHGWPYSPPEVPEPGWALYAAAVFNDHNPWWPVMGDVNLYLQRLSHLMRQGENVADIAIYVPTEDIMSGFKPGRDVSVNDSLREHFPKPVIEALLDGGYNFDFIDGDAILSKGIRYPVLLLNDIERISPVVYQRIRAWAEAGGVVLTLGSPPKQAPGFRHADIDSAVVAKITAELFFDESEHAIRCNLPDLVPTLNRVILRPDLKGGLPGLGFVHRRLPDADIYFVANTTPEPMTFRPEFRAPEDAAHSWDPVSGRALSYVPQQEIRLAPYESRVFVFGYGWEGYRERASLATKTVALNEGWRVRIGNGKAAPLTGFTSWSETAATQHYSGQATYTTTIDLTAADQDQSVVLDFGMGKSGLPNERKGPGFYAQLDAPVRDAAEVFVNGQRAGAIWCAPFALEIGGWLKRGRNTLELRVYNTAINALAGRPPEDYSALNARYGERFRPQNMNDLTPLPSGLLTAPVLRIGTDE